MIGNPTRRLLIVLAAVLPSCTAAFAEPATALKHAVESAEVILSFPLGSASVGEVATGEDCIVLALLKEDSSTVAAYTVSGDLLFWHSVASPERPGILLSERV
jgi:hypothetical protein